MLITELTWGKNPADFFIFVFLQSRFIVVGSLQTHGNPSATVLGL